MTTLLITGSRDASKEMLDLAYRSVVRAGDLGWTIIVGDAEGIDKQVQDACCSNNVPFVFYGISPSPRHFCCSKHLNHYIQTYGNYLARDRVMVERADRVLAIWNGSSRGTKYTHDYAVKRGLKVDLRVMP